MAFVVVDYVRQEMRQAEFAAGQERHREEARSAEDVVQFRNRPADAPIATVFHFMFSANETVKREYRERLVKWPSLDDELTAKLNHGDSKWVARFIGEVHPSPSAKLAPPFARYLDKGLSNSGARCYTMRTPQSGNRI